MTSDGGHAWAGSHPTCRQIVEIVNDYLEGILDADASREFERHLVACEGCTAYLEQMRLTTHVAGRLRAADVPAPLMDALITAFRQER